MSYYIIIRGTAGVGKSTISKMLAKEMGAKVFHFDKIMKDLNLDYIKGEKWIPLWKFLKADRAIINNFNKELSSNPIIIDGNFYFKTHIKDLIRKINAKGFIFTLKADLKECIKRDKTRKNCLGEKAVLDVFKFTDKVSHGFVINTKDKNPKQILNIIKKKIT